MNGFYVGGPVDGIQVVIIHEFFVDVLNSLQSSSPSQIRLDQWCLIAQVPWFPGV